ncbi:HemK2/MTQ2 family protein methyltransferase [Streptomyces sp. NPDC052309]|uniref:HemK2/MTQ2 family protein methyltransferase n=1 Tax=Streptomyces sp. NPDC052309 TaxID=3155421 RepID=UPI00343D4496
MKPLVPPGVYAPQQDTALLARALSDESVPVGAAVLDVGTGTGALALAAARRGGRVTAVDVSWRAVFAARVNAARAGLHIRVLRGDLFAPVQGESFDLVLANPPYVPAPGGRRRPRGAARAWDAGPNGRMVLDGICREVPALLRPGGVLLLVQSALSDPGRTVGQLRAAGLKAAVVRRARIAFGPVVRGRERWLRQRGLLSTTDQEEELVIIRAELAV